MSALQIPADTGKRGAVLALLRRVMPVLVTALVFWLILQRVPFGRLTAVLRQADYIRFLSLMVPNAVVYFCWDTLVLTAAVRWFHGPVRFRELLPARAVSYVVALFNTNVARGALAAYLARRLRQPLLQLGSTVIFLVLTEYTHLVAWATLGVLFAAPHAPRGLLIAAPAIAAFWFLFLLYTRFDVRPWQIWRRPQRREPAMPRGGPREWSLLRTFRVAPLRRYVQIVLLRAPMFFASLTAHYFAAAAFDIHVPFVQMIAFLPVIFMIAALPITVAHLGTTQAAWIFFFESWAPAPNLLAFSLAAHATFSVCRALIGLAFTPQAYSSVIYGPAPGETTSPRGETAARTPIAPSPPPAS
jgi:hypothetical protein